MTLRDWFAGQALAGLVASDPHMLFNDGNMNIAAKKCFAVADAMLAEREK